MESDSLAVFSALWLGILTSISPCPLSTNIAAVSYVGRHVGSPRAVLLAGGLYMVGRMLAYVVLGAAAVAVPHCERRRTPRFEDPVS
jgi:cytochrome c-type biogenesis protein